MPIQRRTAKLTAPRRMKLKTPKMRTSVKLNTPQRMPARKTRTSSYTKARRFLSGR